MIFIKRFFPGGIHPIEYLNSKSVSSCMKIENVPPPEKVVIPMNQHLGVPCRCLVKKGELVLKGQLIGEAQGFISSNIHASVSGKVLSVDKQVLSNGSMATAVTIQNDYNDTWVDLKPCENPNDLSVEEFSNIIKESGIVGLGGAAFPSHVKMLAKEEIDTLVINAAECEPYLSADHRLMLEESDGILDGINLVKNTLNIKRVIIGIENNKKDAIKLLNSKLDKFEGISVKALNTVYPQGGEKQLIYATTKRVVKMGALPASIGVIVINVGTAYAIHKAIRYGQPLIDRIITVTGNVKTPKNFKAPVGTLLSHLVDCCGGLNEGTKILVSGGPMMGMAISHLEIPMVKGGSGLLALERSDSADTELDCIRCSRCNYSCPMKLTPSEIDRNVRFDKGLENEKLAVMNCIECGVCSWVCPSKRRLTQSCKFSKLLIREEIRKRQEEAKVNGK